MIKIFIPKQMSPLDRIIFSLCFTSICFMNCSKINDEPLICTENFVTITLQITGEPPSDFYTIRLATGDTLRHQWVYKNYYPVVDDNLVGQMEKDVVEDFRFVGKRDENTINMRYKIKSDGCHVVKVEGLETIM